MRFTMVPVINPGPIYSEIPSGLLAADQVRSPRGSHVLMSQSICFTASSVLIPENLVGDTGHMPMIGAAAPTKYAHVREQA